MQRRRPHGQILTRALLALLVCVAGSVWPSQGVAAVESTTPCLYLDSRQWGTADAALIPVASDFTVELWVYLPQDLNSYQEFISQGAQPAPFYLGVTPDETIRAGDRWSDTGRRVPIGKWTHLAVTHSDQGRGQLYVDGVQQAVTDSYVVSQVGSPTRIGAQFGNDSPGRPTACVAGIRGWSAVRTAEEIRSDMAVSPVPDAQNLLFEIQPTGAEVGNVLTARTQSGTTAFTFAQPLEFGNWSNPVPGNARKPLPVFPVCTQPQQSACIESLVAITDSGQRRAARLTGRDAPPSGSFASEQLAGTVPEWRIPDTINEDGRSEFVVEAFYFPFGAPYCWGPLRSDCSSDVDEIVMNVWTSPLGPDLPVVDVPDGPDEICGTPSSPITCRRAWKLNADVRYEVALRLPSGFRPSLSHMAGQEGSLAYSDLTSEVTRVTLTTRPTDQTVVFDTAIRPATVQSAERADATINTITLYLASVKQGHNAWLAKCGGGKGMMIWRNGVVMSWPSWSKSDQVVSMQVRSAHIDAQGATVKGFLQIAVPVALAKCLWGVNLSKAALGKVAVLYDDQSTNSTAVTSTRVENATYVITSTGFHYSTATIHVKMSQAAPAKSTKMGTITCVQGKRSKAVTAVKPICPSGWRKRT